MAVPKRRKSKSKVRTNRAHKSLTRPNTIFCKKCGAATLPHRVCAQCGYYQGRDVLKKDA